MFDWWRIKEEILKPLLGLLLLPYVLYKEARQQLFLWQTKTHAPFGGKGGQTREGRALFERLRRFRNEAPLIRERVCRSVVEKVFTDSASAGGVAAYQLLTAIIEEEGVLTVPDSDTGGRKLSTSELWEREGALRRCLDALEKPQVLEARLESLLSAIVQDSDLTGRGATPGEEATVSVPLYTLLPSPVLAVERALREIVTEPRADSPFYRLWWQLTQNLLIASGIDPGAESAKQAVWPSGAKMEVEQLMDAYIGNTPLVAFFRTAVPFDVF
jgi:hypothetical protein